MGSVMHWSTSIAALLSGIAFVTLLAFFPMIVDEIASMEEELTLHRNQFTTMSNDMWNDLMTQSAVIRNARAIRKHHSKPVQRKRRQYDSDGGYGGSSTEGDSEGGGYGDDKVAGESEGKVNKCPRGPKGPPGDDGMKGMDGMDGVDGKNGLDGESVPYTSGPCAPCPPGPPGFPGYKGRRGPRGPHGKKGPAGSAGRDGEAGVEGTDGEIGPIGETGQDGEQGEPGKDGQRYKKAPKGPKGKTGPVGPEGDEGPPGERGENGAIGNAGEPGFAGPDGTPGRKGPKGHQGKPGKSGSDGEYCPCPDRSTGGNGEIKEGNSIQEAKASEKPLNGPAQPAGRPARKKGGARKSYGRPGIRPKNEVQHPVDSANVEKAERDYTHSIDGNSHSEIKMAVQNGEEQEEKVQGQVSGNVKSLRGRNGKPRKNSGRKGEIHTTTASADEEEETTEPVEDSDIEEESVDETTVNPTKSSPDLEKDYSEDNADKAAEKSGFEYSSNDIKSKDNAKSEDNGDNQDNENREDEEDEDLPAAQPYDKRAAAARLRRKHRTL